MKFSTLRQKDEQMTPLAAVHQKLLCFEITGLESKNPLALPCSNKSLLRLHILKTNFTNCYACQYTFESIISSNDVSWTAANKPHQHYLFIYFLFSSGTGV